MKRLFLLSFLLVSLLLAPLSKAISEVPKTLNIQGYLVDDNNDVYNGTIPVTFEIYDAETGGNWLWGETQNVNVEDGYYAVELGKEDPINLNFDKQYFVQVTVGNNAPFARTPLTSSPYSFFSDEALKAGEAETAKFAEEIADGSVTLAKLADDVRLFAEDNPESDIFGELPNLKIKEGVITQAMLSSNVTTPPSGPASGDLTGNYPDPLIAPGAVKENRIADGAISTRTLMDGAVTYSKFQNASPGAAVGTILGWDGSQWIETTVPDWEVDGVIGNEVAGVIPDGGLELGGSGTAVDPWTVGIMDGGVDNDMIADGVLGLEKLQPGTQAGQIIYWDALNGEWVYNAGPEPTLNQTLKWVDNGVTNELQWADDEMTIPFWYDNISEDDMGNPVTSFWINKTDGGGTDAYAVRAEISDENAGSAIYAKNSGLGIKGDASIQSNLPVIVAEGETNLSFQEGALNVEANVESIDGGASRGAMISQNVDLDNGYNAEGLTVNNTVLTAGADVVHAGIHSIARVDAGNGTNAGVIGHSVGAGGDLQVGVAGMANTPMGYYNTDDAPEGSVAVLAVNQGGLEDDYGVGAQVTGMGVAGAFLAENNIAVEAETESAEFPAIAGLNVNGGPALWAISAPLEGNAVETDYSAVVLNLDDATNQPVGRGMLVLGGTLNDENGGNPFIQDPNDDDDAALVVVNPYSEGGNAATAIKTYGDIWANSAIGASELIGIDRIIVGDPYGEYIELLPPMAGMPFTIDDNTMINGTLEVADNTTLGGTLDVANDVTSGGNGTFDGNGTFGGDGSFGGMLTVGTDVTAGGNGDFGGNGTFGGNGSFGGDLVVDGNTNLNGTLDVVGNAAFDEDVYVAGDVAIDGMLTIDDVVAVNGTFDNLMVNTQVMLDPAATLNVNGTNGLPGQFLISNGDAGTPTWGSTIPELTVNSLSANDAAINNAVITTSLDVSAGTTILGETTTGDLSVAGQLAVDNGALIDNGAIVNGDFNLLGNAEVIGNVEVVGAVDALEVNAIEGNFDLLEALVVNAGDLNATVGVVDDLTVNTAFDATTALSALGVTSTTDLTVAGQLVVDNGALIDNGVIVNGDVDVIGDVDAINVNGVAGNFDVVNTPLLDADAALIDVADIATANIAEANIAVGNLVEANVDLANVALLDAVDAAIDAAVVADADITTLDVDGTATFTGNQVSLSGTTELVADGSAGAPGALLLSRGAAQSPEWTSTIPNLNVVNLFADFAEFDDLQVNNDIQANTATFAGDVAVNGDFTVNGAQTVLSAGSILADGAGVLVSVPLNVLDDINGMNATFTGDVVVPTPDAAMEATTKQYVDDADAALAVDIADLQAEVDNTQSELGLDADGNSILPASNYFAAGDDYATALGNLDTQAKANEDEIDANDADIAANAADIDAIEALADNNIYVGVAGVATELEFVDGTNTNVNIGANTIQIDADVITDGATIEGDGTAGNPITLSTTQPNANTWAAAQTFNNDVTLGDGDDQVLVNADLLAFGDAAVHTYITSFEVSSPTISLSGGDVIVPELTAADADDEAANKKYVDDLTTANTNLINGVQAELFNTQASLGLGAGGNSILPASNYFAAAADYATALVNLDAQAKVNEDEIDANDADIADLNDGNWTGVQNFADGATSGVAPVNADDLTRKDYVDSEIVNNTNLLKTGVNNWTNTNNVDGPGASWAPVNGGTITANDIVLDNYVMGVTVPNGESIVVESGAEINIEDGASFVIDPAGALTISGEMVPAFDGVIRANRVQYEVIEVVALAGLSSVTPGGIVNYTDAVGTVITAAELPALFPADNGAVIKIFANNGVGLTVLGNAVADQSFIELVYIGGNWVVL